MERETSPSCLINNIYFKKSIFWAFSASTIGGIMLICTYLSDFFMASFVLEFVTASAVVNLLSSKISKIRIMSTISIDSMGGGKLSFQMRREEESKKERGK